MGCLYVSPTLDHSNSQGGPHSNDKEHSERNAFVQVPVLHGNGHHQPPDEQYVGVLEVLYADLESGDVSETLGSFPTHIPPSLWGVFMTSLPTVIPLGP